MTVLLKGELYPFASLYIKAGEGGTPTTSVSKYYSGGSIPFIKIIIGSEDPCFQLKALQLWH